MDPWDIDSPALDLLEDCCSFALGAMPSGLSMLPESDELEVIAGDGSGGCFYLWHAQGRGDQVPVVYLSSYGEASRFAEDFTAALTIVTAFPGYWCDILVSAHKGKSDDLLDAVIRHYEADLDAECMEARDELCRLLQLNPAVAASQLVAAVRTTPAFSPLLVSREGMTPATSFRDRLAPR
jgi:hypothetical protein